MGWDISKEYTISQLSNIIDEVTKANASYMETNIASHIYDIMSVLRGGDGDDYIVWAAQYTHLNTAYSDAVAGGKVLVLTGTYDLNGSPFLINDDHTKIVSLGATITNTGAVCDAFDITGDYCSIQGPLLIDGGVGNKVERGFDLSGAHYCSIGGGIRVYRTNGTGIYLGGSYSKENYFHDILLIECGDSSIVLNVADNNDFEHIYSISGQSTSRDFYIIQSDSCCFDKCRISAPAGHGMEITSNTYAFMFKNGNIGGCQKHGVYINGCKNIVLAGNMLHWNSKGGVNTYDNIAIEGTTERTQIYDNTIFSTKEPDDGLTAYGRYGIYMNGAGVTHSNIHDNFIFGHNTDGIRINGGDYNNLHDNEIYDNVNVGLYVLANSTKNHAKGNNCYNNGVSNILDLGDETTLDNYEDG
jgi:hypothetical protein